ncbi:ABC transporter ATP-binding protein [Geomonas edaphica]|uniref:ABC transporter ATP-binding protein n=1 Tax=Geomonas edaphica TaxID=2570226 RepID=UPI0010A8BA8E|nr:ABC transporter ATP-binding protein [Geomonas edaphica]
MSGKVISVENLSKRYRLGVVSHQTLMHDFQSWWSRIRGKEDPNSPIDGPRRANADATFWALRDISFEVAKGDVLGVIGRNGAGKTTLLKVLSEVTAPTNGSVRYKGRIASLLEVGTGFHPELTGRENIFLNAALYGMKKNDVRNKIDEIVSFAEIDQFIDTPVKRYSSGMYMRLAFSVAAHLDPDILVVDEVLAVGDAQFQKKCLGKLEDVGKDGRTVLFVSHNMSTVMNLCNRCIILENGRLTFDGDTKAGITSYLKTAQITGKIEQHHFIGPLSSKIQFTEVAVTGSEEDKGVIFPSSEIRITVKGLCLQYIPRFRTFIILYKDGYRICTLHDLPEPKPLKAGEIISTIKVAPYYLRPGDYYIVIGGHDVGPLGPGTEWVCGNEVASFTIQEEWGANNDYGNIGAVNVPHSGERLL